MSSTSFTITSTQFSIFAGLPIFIFGIIGNLINIGVLFSSLSNSCSFLLFVASFFNIIALSAGLLPRVLAIGFGIDPSLTNLICCKSRLFISYIGTITSLAFICLASIDRFFLSCRSVAWRNRSKLSTAKIATLITIPIIIAINLPYLLFYTIITVKSATGNTTTRCSSTNPGLVFYGNYFVRPVLLSILPGTILGISGWLTYRNITSITRIQIRSTFQRSFTSMILLQIFTVVIPIIPFATMNIYQVITSSMTKSSYRIAQETLVLDISNIILYISYASNFYVYLISASSYRRDFMRLVLFCYG
ncbi:unnamed protein product [Rotaria sp. Silwood2]|nr:unnamed protein product [Rotaria sp. Silwood2]CAF2674147.1 unnamed protein product [Rotaria sp. Silwood2]CAF3087299.1 unnamed protein product [Rotaria sp. Silwood2]CAF3875280.1 unnamed protein product [Rotaria sp. Silwood2]CAF3938804.1 unnamed protein product [Rotaria sp. Silwood2]